MSKKKPVLDEVRDGVRVRVYSTRGGYEVIFNDDDIEDMKAEVLCYPKVGTPDVWASQGFLERKDA